MKQGLKDPVAFPVAREALAVFVNKTNPVSHAEGERIREVFTTMVAKDQLNWGRIGATGSYTRQPINIVSRTSNCGTQKFLRGFIFKDYEMRECESQYPSNSQVLEAVGKDPYSIAICGMRSTGDNVKMLHLWHNGTEIASDDLSVMTGKYPFTRPLNLVVDMGQTSSQAKAAQEFLRFALCRAGQTQTILVGYFPVDLPLLRAGIERLEDATVR